MQVLTTDPKKLAAAVPWLAQLPASSRDWLVEQLVPLSLQGGETLFSAGDPPDAVYLVVSGSLAAFSATDALNPIGQVVAGETVGETGLITGKPRSATVRALRDCELLRLDRAIFEQMSLREPAALLAIARQALERAAMPQQAQRSTIGPRTLALLPQCDGMDTRTFAEALGKALEPYGNCAIVDATSGAEQPSSYFSKLEGANRFVIYLADAAASPWRELCLRQADALLFLVSASAQPAAWADVMRGVVAPLPRPEHLILIHSNKPRLGAARRWSKHRPQARTHHVRTMGDVPRIARLIIGKATSLVLSGGGARGFAHLGVIKALREAGMVIDCVGGTSIGGIIGAGVAADWSDEEMEDVYRRSFVNTNPLSDYTFPFVSLVSGRKVSRLLRQSFGEREIEDLVLPFYCVSSNLTTGRAAVHRNGPLWQWLRASVAIPGVLPPVFHRGEVFVDGGVINNLPVDVMRDSQRGEIIAVDIGGDHAVSVVAGLEEFDLPPLWSMIVQWFTGRRRPSIVQIMLRAGMVNSGYAAFAARSASTVLITPPLASIDLLDWQAFDRAIDIGYQHTLRTIGGQRDALSAQTPLM